MTKHKLEVGTENDCVNFVLTNIETGKDVRMRVTDYLETEKVEAFFKELGITDIDFTEWY